MSGLIICRGPKSPQGMPSWAVRTMDNWCTGCELGKVHLSGPGLHGHFSECYDPQPIDQEVADEIEINERIDNLKQISDTMLKMGGWEDEVKKEIKEAGIRWLPDSDKQRDRVAHRQIKVRQKEKAQEGGR